MTVRPSRFFSMAALTLVAALPACGEGLGDELLAEDEFAPDAVESADLGDPGDSPDDELAEPSDDGPFDAPVLGTATQAIRGFVASGPIRGIIKITVAGQADTRTGIQLRADLVVTSNAFIGHNTAPGNVTVTAAPGTAGVQSVTARGVNASDYFPTAVLHHDDFSAANTAIYSIDRRTPAQLTNEILR